VISRILLGHQEIEIRLSFRERTVELSDLRAVSSPGIRIDSLDEKVKEPTIGPATRRRRRNKYCIVKNRREPFAYVEIKSCIALVWEECVEDVRARRKTDGGGIEKVRHDTVA
jgi:hypothetical protein